MKRSLECDSEPVPSPAAILFDDYPVLAWRLVAQPWLSSLRDRMALALTSSALYSYAAVEDKSIAFLRSLSQEPNLMAGDKARRLKRSGRLDCVRFQWARESTPMNNGDLYHEWVTHVVEAADMVSLRWLLHQARFGLSDWTLLQPSVVQLLLEKGQGDTAFSLLTNEGGAWWDAQLYATHLHEPHKMLTCSSGFISAKRYDLFARLCCKEFWPVTPADVATGAEFTPMSRFSLAIIAAVLTQSPKAFDAWWESDQRKEFGEAARAANPPGSEDTHFLGGITWMMLRNGSPQIVMAVSSMLETLATYIPDLPQ